MASVNVSVRMDENLKKQFEAFCEDVGLTMSSAITVFAKKTVTENRIPFEIGRDVPNEETVQAIAEAKRMLADPSIGKTYTSVEDLFKDLGAGNAEI